MQVMRAAIETAKANVVEVALDLIHKLIALRYAHMAFLGRQPCVRAWVHFLACMQLEHAAPRIATTSAVVQRVVAHAKPHQQWFSKCSTCTKSCIAITSAVLQQAQ